MVAMKNPISGQVSYEPFWWEDAPLTVQAPSELSQNLDAAIIGGGFSGLSAARALAKSGLESAVFDKGPLGFGASTRNGGQVGSGNQSFKVGQLRADFGDARTREILNEGMAAVAFLEQVIAEDEIDCDFRRCGRFRGASRPEHYDSMARELEALADLTGINFEMVPAEQIRTEIDSRAFFGGSLLPDDAGLHPAKLHGGLVRTLKSLGVALCPGTEVVSIERDANSYRLDTLRGPVAAREVLVATNGYTGKLKPFTKKIVPVGSAIIASDELDPDLALGLLPKDRVYGMTRRVFNYFRLSPNKRRLLFGGRGEMSLRQDEPAAFRHLYREMCAIFPQLDGIGVTHCWSGWLGFTRDHFPKLGRQDDIYFALGLNGTGVSRACHIGHQAAGKLLGHEDAGTAFDGIPFQDFPCHPLAKAAVPWVMNWYRFRDRFGI
jgi:glycine/D-amino acid oxidase-like deaminating enzyme